MAGGGWISLPAELLKEVSDRLPADADQIHIRQVCSHWRATTVPLAACRPWVVDDGKIGRSQEYTYASTS